MDLTLPIAYNAFSINTVSRTSGGIPMSGYEVDEINVSQVDVRGFTDASALKDGIVASDIYLGARRIEAIVSVFGSTKGDFWDKAQDLLSHFSPTIAFAADTANLGFLPFDFYQPTADIATFPTSAYPNGIPMRLYLRPSGLPAYTSRRDDQGGVSGKGTSKQFRIPLIARDPRKVLQSETTVSITSNAGSASASAAYKGDYPTTGFIKISGATATGTVRVAVNSVASFSAGNPVGYHQVTIAATTTTYYIDLSNRALRQDATTGTIRMDLFTAGTWHWPGEGTSVVLMKNAGTFDVQALYREAFA